MSTKIYDGFRIHAGPGGVLAFVRRAAAVFEAAFREEYDRIAAPLATYFYDARLTGLPVHGPPWQAIEAEMDPTRSAMSLASKVLDEVHLHVQRSGYRHGLDLSVGLWLADDPDGDPEVVYAIVTAPNERYFEEFSSLPGVEYWGYWDNADRPDDVSPDAWGIRAQVWNRVVPRTAPVPVGGRYDFPSPRLTPTMAAEHFMPQHPERLVPHLPTVADRAAHLAGAWVVDHPTSYERAKVDECVSWLISPEAAALRAERTAPIVELLTPLLADLGADDLTRPLSGVEPLSPAPAELLGS